MSQQPNDAESIKLATYRDALNVRFKNLLALRETLAEAFSVESLGFAEFADIHDVQVRAVVSDQICRSASAVTDQLAQAQRHCHCISELLERDELKRIGREQTASATIAWLDLNSHLAGFFSAATTALDCLAAVVVGVERIPTSITKASFKDLVNLKNAKASSEAQRSSWVEVHEVVRRRLSDEPNGWWNWLIAMRNAQVHRTKQMTVFLPKGEPPKVFELAIPASEENNAAVSALQAYDLYLRREPGQEDLMHLTAANVSEQLHLGEPAGTSLAGAIKCVNDLAEELGELVLRHWTDIAGPSSDFPSPMDRWKPIDESCGFEGFAPVPLAADLGMILVSPYDEKRLGVVAKLKEFRIQDP